jgi:hypothetical protein
MGMDRAVNSVDMQVLKQIDDRRILSGSRMFHKAAAWDILASDTRPGQTSDHRDKDRSRLSCWSYCCRKNCQSTKDMAARRHLIGLRKGEQCLLPHHAETR